MALCCLDCLRGCLDCLRGTNEGISRWDGAQLWPETVGTGNNSTGVDWWHAVVKVGDNEDSGAVPWQKFLLCHDNCNFSFSSLILTVHGDETHLSRKNASSVLEIIRERQLADLACPVATTDSWQVKQILQEYLY